jgi:anti-sigma factor RsiW
MRCEEAISLMPAYLEGELPWEKKLELEEHLSSCVSCARKCEELKRNREFLSKEKDNILKAPRALIEGVLEQIRKEKENLRRRARTLQAGLLGVFIALFTAFLAIFLRRRRHQLERR